jgi:hypothetical protein
MSSSITKRVSRKTKAPSSYLPDYEISTEFDKMRFLDHCQKWLKASMDNDFTGVIPTATDSDTVFECQLCLEKFPRDQVKVLYHPYSSRKYSYACFPCWEP